MRKRYFFLAALILTTAGCVQTKQADYSKPLGQLVESVNKLSEKIDSVGKRVENLEKVGANGSATQNIPPSVLGKYQELESEYRTSLGADIASCTKNSEKIYTVSGNGGYTGVTFYYTADGRNLGFSSFSDVIDLNNPPPKQPIAIEEYKCTIIKKSEQGL